MPQAFDFVGFNSSATGTADFTVNSAMTNFYTPAQAGVPNGARVIYRAKDTAGDRCMGIGVYNSSGPSITRDANEVRIVSGTKSTAKLSVNTSAEVIFAGVEGAIQLLPDVLSQASASTLAPDIDNYSSFRFTALAAAQAVNAWSGTPYDGQVIEMEWRDDGTERALTWDTDSWKSGFSTGLPASTGDGTVYSVKAVFQYDAGRSVFVCQSVSEAPVAFATLQYVGGAKTNFDGTAGTKTLSLSSLTGGLASAPAEGDLVVVNYAVAGSGGATQSMVTSGYGNSTTVHTNTDLLFAMKIMGSTPDTQVQVSDTGNGAWAGTVEAHVWRNVDPDTPLDVASVSANGSGTGRPDPGAITPVSTGAVIIVAGAAQATTGAVFTATELSNFISDTGADNVDSMGGLGSYAWSSGAFNPAQWTGGTTGGTDKWAAVTAALRPKSLN